MITKKREKNELTFNCKKCDFKCVYKSDYKRHLMTAKHKMITNDNIKTRKNEKDNKCECGKIFKFSSGLSRHKKKCSYLFETKNELIQTTNDTNTDKDKLILDLLAQNKELITMLNETIPKIGNNNNNTINNHFNIQNFLNEDCKDAINFSEFIENLQELGTHKRPIHCTDKKRKTLYIKENNEWDKEGSQNILKKGIREVSRKGFECLMKEKQENQEEYKDIESDFTQKCLSIHRNILPGVPQETTINKVIEKISQKSGIIE